MYKIIINKQGNTIIRKKEKEGGGERGGGGGGGGVRERESLCSRIISIIFHIRERS